jgi:hypothetical protein
MSQAREDGTILTVICKIAQLRASHLMALLVTFLAFHSLPTTASQSGDTVAVDVYSVGRHAYLGKYCRLPRFFPANMQPYVQTSTPLAQAEIVPGFG